VWIPFICAVFAIIVLAVAIRLIRIDRREGPEEEGPWGGGGGGSWDGDPKKPLPTGGGWDVPDYFPFEWAQIPAPRVIPKKEEEK
jgi:hypothetical protein